MVRSSIIPIIMVAPDEFQFGQNGQMVEGLKNAISIMKYGQKAKVLIPSDIGFKEKGSAGNIVPPYTPVSLLSRNFT